MAFSATIQSLQYTRATSPDTPFVVCTNFFGKSQHIVQFQKKINYGISHFFHFLVATLHLDCSDKNAPHLDCSDAASLQSTPTTVGGFASSRRADDCIDEETLWLNPGGPLSDRFQTEF